MQVLYIISYKKEQNLQLLHAISSYQLQYNKSSTLQEKLSSKGEHTNIALHKLHGTFAYTISFDSLGKKKNSPANPDFYHMLSAEEKTEP